MYSNSAQRLISAAADGDLYTYDVLHSYQPSHVYSAPPHDGSPCLAITNDDAVLAVGGLQAGALLLFDCSSMALIKTFSLVCDVRALVFGPATSDGLVLFCSTAASLLLTLNVYARLETHGAVEITAMHSHTIGTQYAVSEALDISSFKVNI